MKKSIEEVKKIVLNNKNMRERLNIVIGKNIKCPICGNIGLDGIMGGYLCYKCNEIVYMENEFDKNIEKYATDKDYIEVYKDINYFNNLLHRYSTFN